MKDKLPDLIIDKCTYILKTPYLFLKPKILNEKVEVLLNKIKYKSSTFSFNI